MMRALSAAACARLAPPTAASRRWWHGHRRRVPARALATSSSAAASDDERRDVASSSPPLPRVLVLAGPTAVGKTSLSLDLASKLDGEIISADSVQVYRGLDVGSGKLAASERRGIAHHALDVLDPSEDFNAGAFVDLALETVEDVVSRGKVPIVVGGTGMYLRWFVGGRPATPASTPESSRAAKEEVRAAAAAAGWDGALKLLRDAGDPDTADRVATNDWYRVERALEILRASGRPLGSYAPESPPPFDFRCVLLAAPRVQLYRRIDDRVECMVCDGMLDEAAMMLRRGIAPGSTSAASAIGYRQAMEFLAARAAAAAGGGGGGGGATTEEDLLAFVEKTQRATRAFAKRQLTWFRGEPEGRYRWISASDGEEAAAREAMDAFERDDDDDDRSRRAPAGGDAGKATGQELQELKRYVARRTRLADAKTTDRALARVDALAASLVDRPWEKNSSA